MERAQPERTGRQCRVSEEELDVSWPPAPGSTAAGRAAGLGGPQRPGRQAEPVQQGPPELAPEPTVAGWPGTGAAAPRSRERFRRAQADRPGGGECKQMSRYKRVAKGPGSTRSGPLLPHSPQSEAECDPPPPHRSLPSSLPPPPLLTVSCCSRRGGACKPQASRASTRSSMAAGEEGARAETASEAPPGCSPSAEEEGRRRSATKCCCQASGGLTPSCAYSGGMGIKKGRKRQTLPPQIKGRRPSPPPSIAYSNKKHRCLPPPPPPPAHPPLPPA